ncbi:hypothetical protein ACWIGW_31015 [Nocardia brasiliensis]
MRSRHPHARGAAPQGAAPQGAAPQGAAPQGTTPQGTTPPGTTPPGRWLRWSAASSLGSTLLLPSVSAIARNASAIRADGRRRCGRSCD